MWFDSTLEIGTFCGNLSMPHIEHLKNSLHASWLWFTQKAENTTGTPASLKTVLTRKDSKLVFVCAIFNL
jgi:hypothetical protein